MSDHIPTLADVCSAIADGHLTPASDGLTYQLNALELRRYFNKRRSLPALSFLRSLASTSSNVRECFSFDLCNFGH